MMKWKMIAKRGLALTLVGLMLTGVGGSPGMRFASAQSVSGSQVQDRLSGVNFYFDTVVTLTLMGGTQDQLDAMWAACARYEALLSKTISTSDVARINKANGQPVTVDPETWEILRQAKTVSDASDHAFSMTIAPVVGMWDFVNGTHRMPTEEQRLAALPLIDDDALVLGEGDTVTLPAGMSIDLGGIAKGYIADQIAAMVAGKVQGAILNFGGNVYVVGAKADGSAFRVGIQDPASQLGATKAIATVRDASVVTSGIYERYFVEDGVWYHHILDPKTGLPADTDLASASIIHESSMLADAYATACIVLGSEKALTLLSQQGLDAMLITREGTVLTTDGFEEKYQLQLN